jgi:hypothetical protein
MKWSLFVAGLGLFACEEASSSGAGADGEAAGGAESGSGGWSGDAGGDPGASGLGGASEGPAPHPCSGFVVSVESVTYGPGAGFGQDEMPGVVFGPPEGGGALKGSLDVVSLGNGGTIILGFGEQTIVDGEGPDFIVFENPFFAGGDESAPFHELATVEVSADGEAWTAFPCTALEAPFGACAGWQPVYAGSADPSIDPSDPELAGGDAFDLAALGLAEARFVRITDRPDQTGFQGAFDLDAIALVHSVCSDR